MKSDRMTMRRLLSMTLVLMQALLCWTMCGCEMVEEMNPEPAEQGVNETTDADPGTDADAGVSLLSGNVFDYPDGNGTYSVVVFLDDVPENAIRERMLSVYGVDLSAFDDEDAYLNQHVPAIEAEYEALTLLEAAQRGVFHCVPSREEAVAAITALNVEAVEAADRANYEAALSKLGRPGTWETVLILSLMEKAGVTVPDDVVPDTIMKSVTTCLTEREIDVLQLSEAGLLVKAYNNMRSETDPTIQRPDGSLWYVAGTTENGETLLDAEVSLTEDASDADKDSVLRTFLEMHFGYNAQAYADEAVYEQMYAAGLEAVAAANAAEAEAGKKPIPYEEMGLTSWRDKLPSSVAGAVNADLEEARRLRLWVLHELSSEKMEQFSKTVLSGVTGVETDFYTTTLWLSADKARIDAIAGANGVTSVYGWDRSTVPVCTDGESSDLNDLGQYLEQIGSDNVTGTHSLSFNNGRGYKGNYLTVGVLEAINEHNPGGRIDMTSPQLSPSNRFTYVQNEHDGQPVYASVSDHATLVTALLAGDDVRVGTHYYSGVLPYASVVQTACSDADNYKTGMTLLAQRGASVINLSLGFPTQLTSYNGLDYWTDKFIRETMIPVVAAAGNASSNAEGRVLSPGKAFNVISVGNAVGCDEDGPMSAPFGISIGSNYVDAALMDQKPDIAAPGTGLGYVRSDGTVLTAEGTSFAAPLVAGVVGQMQEANSLLKLRPAVLTKAMLLLGADPNGISADGNPAVSGCSLLRDQSGAGLLNAVGAVEAARRSANNAALSFNLYTLTAPYTRDFSVHLDAGDHFRVTFVTEANLSEGVNLTNHLCNFDYQLLNSVGTVVASSASTGCVDVMEYTAASEGTYTVRITLTAKNSSPSGSMPFYLTYAFVIGE